MLGKELVNSVNVFELGLRHWGNPNGSVQLLLLEVVDGAEIINVGNNSFFVKRLGKVDLVVL
jgi:hypothetical protein